MKQGRSIQEVLKELTRQQETKKDYVAPAGQIVLQEDGSTLEIGSQPPLATSRLFHRQIASALGIPAKYYDLIEGGDLSMYGLANAVTRTSQDVGSYDRATELEAAGWQIVTKEWRE